MNEIPVSKLTDLGMLRANEAALNLRSQSIRSPDPQEIGGSQCDLPQHHCCAHLVFVFWSLRKNGFRWFYLGCRFSQVKGTNRAARNFDLPRPSFSVFSCGFASPLGSHYSSVMRYVGYKLEVSSEPSVGLQPGL